jgi:NAD(P)-dependent dehydrogenase (short-subunit alcohol dehydrogenase family)
MTTTASNQDKVAIVTGASSGIGQAAAIRLAERGAGVIMTYHRNADGIGDTLAAIDAAGGRALALPLDMGRSDTFGAFAEKVTAALGEHWQRSTFDHLVNNAGFGQMSMFEDTTEELFDQFIRVNFRGPFFLTQQLLPLLADGGSIVNTSSNAALATGTSPGFSAYASSKGALNVWTRVLAKELSPRGIRVNAVSPGPTRTRLGDDGFAKHPELIEPLAAQTALGRIGEADDIGKVVAALSSDDLGWITGENIEVSGGFRM